MPFNIVYKPPPDKSITLRCLVLGGLCGERVEIKNPLICDDTESAIKLLRRIGCDIEKKTNKISIKGPGMYNYRKNVVIDVGQSALLLRLILPVLLNQNANYIIKGRDTIMRRNFKDTLEPFIKLGARIEHSDWHLPFKILPSKIVGGRIRTSSAQVKSSFLIQSLYTPGIWIYEEKKTRDHTENLMRYLGLDVVVRNGWVTTQGSIKARKLIVPGDFSSASPFIVLSAVKRVSILIKNCGINPFRIGLLKLLTKCGVNVVIKNDKKMSGESVGDVEIHPSKNIRGTFIDDTSDMIDEVVLGCIFLSYAEGESKVKLSQSLSNKESDRIKVTIDILRKLGTFKRYADDYLFINGGRVNKIDFIRTYNDHRIAMAGGVLKVINNGDVVIDHPECVSKTYPNFWKDIEKHFGISII